MWIKALGGIFILVSAIALGFNAAAQYMRRTQQIRQLIMCLTSLKSLINYAAMPLSEALSHCVQGIEGPIHTLFTVSGKLLAEQGWLTPKEAFEMAQQQLGNELALEDSEKEILLLFGTHLGNMDRLEQQAYLKMVQDNLQEIEQEAIVLRDRNVKMYRYLGVCGGLAVIILLV